MGGCWSNVDERFRTVCQRMASGRCTEHRRSGRHSPKPQFGQFLPFEHERTFPETSQFPDAKGRSIEPMHVNEPIMTSKASPKAGRNITATRCRASLDEKA